MNESMVDVLIYLYENYMDGEDQPPVDQDLLEDELAEAGFSNAHIRKALHWLDELAEGLAAPGYPATGVGRSMRHFSAPECERLDVAARGLLLFLEQIGILDPISRELVIERVLAIDHKAVSVDEVRWVVLLVLLNSPGQEDAFARMEELIYDEAPAYLH
jgi:Smg protein